jgi:hypothetical protein
VNDSADDLINFCKRRGIGAAELLHAMQKDAEMHRRPDESPEQAFAKAFTGRRSARPARERGFGRLQPIGTTAAIRLRCDSRTVRSRFVRRLWSEITRLADEIFKRGRLDRAQIESVLAPPPVVARAMPRRPGDEPNFFRRCDGYFR